MYVHRHSYLCLSNAAQCAVAWETRDPAQRRKLCLFGVTSEPELRAGSPVSVAGGSLHIQALNLWQKERPRRRTSWATAVRLFELGGKTWIHSVLLPAGGSSRLPTIITKDAAQKANSGVRLKAQPPHACAQYQAVIRRRSRPGVPRPRPKRPWGLVLGNPSSSK